MRNLNEPGNIGGKYLFTISGTDLAYSLKYRFRESESSKGGISW